MKSLRPNPDAKRAFNQVPFIERANGPLYTLFGLGKNKNSLPEGVCFALVTIWYEFLINRGDLIEELNKSTLDPQLINKIKMIQAHSTVQTRYTEIETKALKLKSATKDELATSAHERQMMALEFKDSQATPRLTFDQYKAHLNHLENYNKTQTGLHTINSVNLKNFTGHSIGWTYHNGHYVLFDPNEGEFLFKNFQNFRDYLCDIFLPFLFSNERTNQVLNVSDFYNPQKSSEPYKKGPA